MLRHPPPTFASTASQVTQAWKPGSLEIKRP